MEIFWTKKTQILSKTNDPLGFNQRIRVRFFDLLFRGLTMPVTRAKYYALYPRFIQSLEYHNKLNISSFLKLEKSYLAAAYRHKEESENDHNGILGINGIEGNSDAVINSLDFKIFKNDQSGFNRLKGNLINMGLIIDDSNEKNELKVKLTSLGQFVVDNKLINPNLDPIVLIDEFKKNDCLCKLSKRERFLLYKVFVGDFQVIKKKETYDVIPQDLVDKSFTLKSFLKNLDYVDEVLLFSKIRFNSLMYILHIFNKEPEDKNRFVDELVNDCFNEVKRSEKIKQLWRFYFLVCGFQEVCELTLYLVNEIVKIEGQAIGNKEISCKFETIKKFLKNQVDINPVKEKRNIIQIIHESDGIIKEQKDIKSNMKEIPSLIKEYYAVLYENFQNEPKELIKFLTNIDAIATELTIEEFLLFFDKHKELKVDEFIFHFLKRFCLPRQKNIIKYRQYKGNERILIFETESELIIDSSESKKFTPTNVLTQSKLTNNLIPILTDLNLIFNNKLTEEGINLLKNYNE